MIIDELLDDHDERRTQGIKLPDAVYMESAEWNRLLDELVAAYPNAKRLPANSPVTLDGVKYMVRR